LYPGKGYLKAYQQCDNKASRIDPSSAGVNIEWRPELDRWGGCGFYLNCKRKYSSNGDNYFYLP